LQPNYNVLQEIGWEINVFPVWPVVVWTNDTFMQLLMRLNFHWFMFRQWCIDDFDLICSVRVKMWVLYAYLSLSLWLLSLNPSSIKSAKSVSINCESYIFFFVVNVFNCLKMCQPRKPKPVCLHKVAWLSNQV